jgi:hypothetical protein
MSLRIGLPGVWKSERIMVTPVGKIQFLNPEINIQKHIVYFLYLSLTKYQKYVQYSCKLSFLLQHNNPYFAFVDHQGETQ